MLTTGAEDLIAKVQEAKDAMDIANAAPATTITDEDGKEVKHLHVRLSPAETKRVMSMPVEQRAQIAELILKERRLAAGVKKTVDKLKRAERREAKRKRKARSSGRRSSR